MPKVPTVQLSKLFIILEFFKMKIQAVVDRVLQCLSQPQGGSTLGLFSDWSDSRAQRQPKSNTGAQILI